MIKWKFGLAACFALTGAAYALDLDRSLVAASKGEVFYIEMGESCPLGWTNRSGDPQLQLSYGPSDDMADHDMCIGGF
ncbi:MAG: hypothetical protein OXC60_20455 [Litoreibacter sp.]|nr:hypothetical protein [Litoreibacter sp.]MCY4337029.1 hypothetical protein [Litoreibacter sp.]